MDTETARFELQVLDVMRAKLAKRREELVRLGLRMPEPDIRRFRDESNRYGSEVVVNFFDAEGLDDAIEQLIVHRAERVATVDEITTWFDEVLSDVLERRMGLD